MTNRIKFTVELDPVDQDNLQFLLKAWNARSKVAAVAQALSLARIIVAQAAEGAVLTLTAPGGAPQVLAFPPGAPARRVKRE